MIRAKTVEEYVRLVNEALFETEELRIAAEYDMESMGNTAQFVDELEAGLRELRKRMEEGTYAFENRDLPFMELVNKQDDRYLPFKHLLKVINDTHRHGLDVGDEPAGS